MTLTWPWMLVGLAVLPVLVVAHRRLLAGRAARVRAMAAQGLVLVERRDRLRHLGPALLLGALALLVVALTRPVAAVAEPHREGTVVLAFDVSNSMGATDLRPTRLEAAKAAARGFVAKQPPSVRIAVVAFGSNGVVAQRPTDDRSAVLAAIARLKPQSDTSLAGGILAGLSAIAGRPVHAPSDTENGGSDETPVGYYGGTAIVLLTDGENTSGADPKDLADLASAAGVRIDPVGLGTPAGTVIEVDGFSIATALDEPALRRIADTTGGTYRRASDAATLAAVYDSIQLQWTTRSVPHEITSLVAGVAALLLLAGAGITVLRQGRVV